MLNGLCCCFDLTTVCSEPGRGAFASGRREVFLVIVNCGLSKCPLSVCTALNRRLVGWDQIAKMTFACALNDLHQSKLKVLICLSKAVCGRWITRVIQKGTLPFEQYIGIESSCYSNYLLWCDLVDCRFIWRHIDHVKMNWKKVVFSNLHNAQAHSCFDTRTLYMQITMESVSTGDIHGRLPCLIHYNAYLARRLILTSLDGHTARRR